MEVICWGSAVHHLPVSRLDLGAEMAASKPLTLVNLSMWNMRGREWCYCVKKREEREREREREKREERERERRNNVYSMSIPHTRIRCHVKMMLI
jgi:hypothetical protein